MPQHIVAFGAHPDDIEFGCGAVLIKEIKKGNTVTMVDCSLGEAGTAGTAVIREREAKAAARSIGAAIEFLDFGGDCHIAETVLHRIKLAERIRVLKPDIILAPTPDENQHPDHLAVSRLVRDASRLARYGGLKELKHLPPHVISALYYYAVTRFTSQQPDIIVDISEVMHEWRTMMSCHETQVQNKSYLELQETRSRFLGLSSGVEYAMGLWCNDPIAVDHLSLLDRGSRNF